MKLSCGTRLLIAEEGAGSHLRAPTSAPQYSHTLFLESMKALQFGHIFTFAIKPPSLFIFHCPGKTCKRGLTLIGVPQIKPLHLSSKLMRTNGRPIVWIWGLDLAKDI